MKNWATLEADENRLMNKHYSAGRSGRKINKVIIHHNAGNLTIKSIWDVWQTRQASAHYQVDSGGRIGQLVWDRDTAWHAGNWEANTTSIGIEHADISSKPWRISEACLDNGAHLVAAICHYYKLGRPVWGKNVFGHKHFSSTECPASLAGSQHAAYMARAQYWYDRMSGTKPAPQHRQSPHRPHPSPPPTSTLWLMRSSEASTATGTSASADWEPTTRPCKSASTKSSPEEAPPSPLSTSTPSLMR